MSSVPCSSSIRFLYWSFSFIDVDTLLPMEVDRLLRFVQRSEPCPLSRFKSRSVLRTKIGDSALVLNRQLTRRQLEWKAGQISQFRSDHRQSGINPRAASLPPCEESASQNRSWQFDSYHSRTHRRTDPAICPHGKTRLSITHKL